jgi:hypothetical protein
VATILLSGALSMVIAMLAIRPAITVLRKAQAASRSGAMARRRT